MKAIWKRFYAFVAIPFRFTVFIFRGTGAGPGRLAGRYTKAADMKDFEPSADYLIG